MLPNFSPCIHEVLVLSTQSSDRLEKAGRTVVVLEEIQVTEMTLDYFDQSFMARRVETLAEA